MFVPANSVRFIGKASMRGADAIILDLEDAVPQDEKPRARKALGQSVAVAGVNGTPILVRVNSDIRNLAADLDHAVTQGVAALVLPKVESGDRV